MLDYKSSRHIEEEYSISFKELFESMFPKLMRLACRFVDDETAEDMVQEVFLDLWVQRGNEKILNVPSYLYKSVQNKCLNYIKHQSVVEGYSAQLKIALARVNYLASDNQLFKQISDKNIREIIESAVKKLPPKCQEAFRLCYFYGMTNKEAAEEMGLSPRTVEGHVQKAVGRLRDQLSPLL